MQDHLGQLCGEIKSSREQYVTKSLKKRKHEEVQELREVGVTASKFKPYSIGQRYKCPLVRLKCVFDQRQTLITCIPCAHNLSIAQYATVNSEVHVQGCTLSYKQLSLWQVPSFVVLTTVTEWLFYKFDPQSQTLYEAGPMVLPFLRDVWQPKMHNIWRRQLLSFCYTSFKNKRKH